MRKSDVSKRLKEALKTRIQPSHEEAFHQGDKIISSNKNDVWDCPTTVIAKESNTLHIVINGKIRKITICQARKWVE